MPIPQSVTSEQDIEELAEKVQSEFDKEEYGAGTGGYSGKKPASGTSKTVKGIRQQVIAANVAWKATYTSSYIGVALLKVAAIEYVPFTGSNVPFRNSRDNPPKNGRELLALAVNAIEYP